MYPLNVPDIDVTNDPAPHHDIEGDIHDDDAAVLDEQFEAMPSGPIEQGGIAYEKEELPGVTRLMSRTVRFTSADGIAFPDPLQVYPDDPNREELIIRINVYNPIGCSDAAAIAIGSDKSECYNGNNIWNNNATNQSEWRSTKHTGAIWLYLFLAPTATPEAIDIIMTVTVVTK